MMKITKIYENDVKIVGYEGYPTKIEFDYMNKYIFNEENIFNNNLCYYSLEYYNKIEEFNIKYLEKRIEKLNKI